MPKTTLISARIIGGGTAGLPSDILLEDGLVARISPAGELPPEGRVEDCRGAFAAPGYVDLHTHGGGGADVMDARDDALERIASFHLANGTTSFLATTLTAPLADIKRAVEAVAAYRGGGARILGVHLEGPFLSPTNAGAQNRRYLRVPDREGVDFVLSLAPTVRRVTVAPDLPGVLEFVSECAAAGIAVSAGHDGAVDEEIEAAIEAGLDCVTHIYCCTSGISRRNGPRKHLGLTEIGMSDDRLAVEVIADRRHTPDALFGLILRAKGKERVCLVSDSIRVAGMPDGEYDFPVEGGRVRKEGDEASIPGLGVYAGSVTPLGAMVRNIVAHNAVTLPEAVYMATAVPARLLGMPELGELREGASADLNVLDPRGGVLATFIGGERAWT